MYFVVISNNDDCCIQPNLSSFLILCVYAFPTSATLVIAIASAFFSYVCAFPRRFAYINFIWLHVFRDGFEHTHIHKYICRMFGVEFRCYICYAYGLPTLKGRWRWRKWNYNAQHKNIPTELVKLFNPLQPVLYVYEKGFSCFPFENKWWKSAWTMCFSKLFCFITDWAHRASIRQAVSSFKFDDKLMDQTM